MMYLVTVSTLVTLALHTHFSLGATLPQPLNVTSWGDIHCTSLEVWTGGTLPNMADCTDSVDDIWNRDVRRNPYMEYEFVSPGARRATRFPPIVTPRKYQKGEYRTFTSSMPVH